MTVIAMKESDLESADQSAGEWAQTFTRFFYPRPDRKGGRRRWYPQTRTHRANELGRKYIQPSTVGSQQIQKAPDIGSLKFSLQKGFESFNGNRPIGQR